MASMDQRERWLAALGFESPDKIPFNPGMPREKTLRRWRAEGLPPNRDWFDFLCETIGITVPMRGDPSIQPDVNFRMIPTFEEKVLEHKNGHYVVQDWMGNIVEISDEYDYTYLRFPKDFVTRKWHAFPVSCRADFEEMKKRYNPADPSRYPADFDERVRRLRDRDYITAVKFSGPFWQMREWCGMEPLCVLLMEDPDFVGEMAAFWTGFVSAVMARALDSGIVDQIWISEDMAYKQMVMISPAMTRKYLQPAWTRWAREARQAGVPLVDEDSDGKVELLIPIWIESGINVCDPVEVAAGNDINAYREKFGRRIAFRDGIDKRCIARGGRIVEDELQRVAPVVRDGGYVPGCDHGVPHDISWPNFVHYASKLAELTGWL